MRDENGFKCHVASETHVRQMMLIGEDPRKAINDYSNQFLSDFLKLLRTGHGEKKINVNHFYQEYISNKEHVHMNATRWASLTEFAKYLGRGGICRVEEEEADENGRGGGLMISWIDNSPEALRRQDALRKKERQDRGDEEREWSGIREQIAKARKDGLDEDDNEGEGDEARTLQRKEGEKITLSFGIKKSTATPSTDDDEKNAASAAHKPPSPPLTEKSESSGGDDNNKATPAEPTTKLSLTPKPATTTTTTTSSTAPPKNINKNPLLLAKKPKPNQNSNPLTQSNPPKISEAERIMREEIERRQRREASSKHDRRRAGDDGVNWNAAKRQRVI